MTDRLKLFLPQLEKANAELDEKSAGLEDVGEDEDHIEMVCSRRDAADLESWARSFGGERMRFK